MEVDFYALERSVQDRFADATRGIGLPAPIAREPATGRRALFWWAGAVGAGLLLAFALGRGFGVLESPAALLPIAYIPVLAGLAAIATFCALRAMAFASARRSVHYQPGLFLFPAGVFDARSEPLRVFRPGDLKKVEVRGASLVIETGSGAFEFRFPDAASAEGARAALADAERQYQQARQAEARRDEAMLDPLVDSGFSNPFSSQQRILRTLPAWARPVPGVVIALVLGAALGSALWKTRNVLSERRLYTAVKARGDVEGYRAYLARGGPRTEVSDVLLPQAELKVAARAGTVEALEAYVASHPGSKIQGQVDAALRAAVGAELAAARASGSVTALREFERKRAHYSFIVPALEAARVALYRKYLDGFAQGRDPKVVSLYERLLGHSKAHGPDMALQFVRKRPESVERADDQVRRSAYFMGNDSVPSQYFEGQYAERREAECAPRLIALVTEGLPQDVLRMQVAPPVTSGDPPAPSVPTLFVEYAPEMSGGYMSPKPRGVFVGVGMMFRVSFQIPGDTQPLEFKFSVWRTPNPQILKAEGAKVADVYEKMASDGFDKFLKAFTQFVANK